MASTRAGSKTIRLDLSQILGSTGHREIVEALRNNTRPHRSNDGAVSQSHFYGANEIFGFLPELVGDVMRELAIKQVSY